MFVRELGRGGPRSRLLRALDQFFHAPALVAGKGSRFDDQYAVAHFVFVLLVVSLVLLAARHELAVLGVRQAALDHDDAGLLHLVAGDHPDLLAAPRLGTAARLLLGFCLGHDYFSLLTAVWVGAPVSAFCWRSFSVSTVFTRAMSRRAWRSSMVFSSWFVTAFMRCLKMSSCSFLIVACSSSGSLPRRSLAVSLLIRSAPERPPASGPRACAQQGGRPDAPASRPRPPARTCRGRGGPPPPPPRGCL